MRTILLIAGIVACITGYAGVVSIARRKLLEAVSWPFEVARRLGERE